MNEKEKTTLHIVIDARLKKEIQIKAIQLDTTASELIEKIVKEWLEKHVNKTK